MKKTKYTVLAAVAYLALTGILAITTSPSVSADDPRKVFVVNESTRPLFVHDVNDPSGQPVQAIVSERNLNRNTYTVPDGKRLVIEHVSGSVFANNGNIIEIEVKTTVGSAGAFHNFPLLHTFVGPNLAFYISTYGGPARLYADAGTTVELQVSRADPPPTDYAAVASFSGYLVDVP